MSGRRAGPPRLARALLDWLLPPGDAGAAKQPAGHRTPLPARARPFAAKADRAIKAGNLAEAKLQLKIAIMNCGGAHPTLEAKLAEIDAKLKMAADP